MKSSIKIRQTARETYNNKLYQRYIKTACKKIDEFLNLSDELIVLKSKNKNSLTAEELEQQSQQIKIKMQLANDHFVKCSNKVSEEIQSGHIDSDENILKHAGEVAIRIPLMAARRQEMTFVDNKLSPFSHFSKN